MLSEEAEAMFLLLGAMDRVLARAICSIVDVFHCVEAVLFLLEVFATLIEHAEGE